MKTSPPSAAAIYSVWGLSAVALAGLMLTRELEILTLACIFTLLPLFFHFERNRRLKKAPWLENSLVTALLAGSICRFFFFKESFILSVAEFLVFFLLVKCAFAKGRDDLLQMIALSFFLLLSTSTLALDFTFIFSFSFYVLAAAWTLSLFTLDSEGGAGASGAFFKEAGAHLRRNCWITLVLSVFFAGAIFVFFPRLSLAVFQGAFLGSAHQTGFTEKVALQKSGKIYKDPKVALRIEILSPESKSEWQGYLRGQALSRFNGREWTAGRRRGTLKSKDDYRSRILNIRRVTKNRFDLAGPQPESWKRDFAMRLEPGSFLRQKIYMESMDTSILFAAPWIQSLTAAVPRVTVYADGSVQRPSDFRGRISYEAVSLVERPQASLLAQRTGRRNSQAAPLEPESSAENLQLPGPESKDFIDLERIRELAEKIVSGRDSAYAKAVKIERHLRENYAYTLEPSGSDNSRPIEDFLFVSKEGHCEYYASAMALLLRLQGIPARVVTGFLVGELNPNGNYYVVRAQDAHAWVEAWMNGIWAEFDPTPRVNRFEKEEGTLWTAARQKLDYLNFMWNLHVLSYDMDSQQKIARNIDIKSNRISRDLEKRTARWRNAWKSALVKNKKRIHDEEFVVGNTWISIAVIISGFLFSATLIWAGIKGYFKHKPGRQPYWFYKEMIRILEKRGCKKNAAETPYEFARRISEHDHKNELDCAVQSLTFAYCKLRYSGRNLPSSVWGEIESNLIILQKNHGKLTRTFHL